MFQQLKIATGDETIKRRIVRNVETTTSTNEASTTTITNDETTTSLDDMVLNDSETTTEWSSQR